MGMVSRTWDVLETRWKALPQRQRVALGFFVSWLAYFVLDQIGEAAKQSMPLLGSGLAAVRPVLMNQLVIGSIAGGLLIGFWPNLVSALRRAWLRSVLAFLVVGSISFFAGTMLAGWSDPETFTPSPKARVNDNKTPRVFTTKTPRELIHIRYWNTKIAADKLLHAYIGQWIAITGKVDDASFSDKRPGYLIVGLSGDIIQAQLLFSPKWKSALQDVAKGQRIYAVCQIAGFDPTVLLLSECELTQ